MPMIEKELADALVDLRASIALGHAYVPASDHETALQAHLDREMWWRAQMGRMTAEITPIAEGGT
jgi:hypothetical protein